MDETLHVDDAGLIRVRSPERVRQQLALGAVQLAPSLERGAHLFLEFLEPVTDGEVMSIRGIHGFLFFDAQASGLLGERGDWCDRGAARLAGGELATGAQSRVVAEHGPALQVGRGHPRHWLGDHDDGFGLGHAIEVAVRLAEFLGLPERGTVGFVTLHRGELGRVCALPSGLRYGADVGRSQGYAHRDCRDSRNKNGCKFGRGCEGLCGYRGPLTAFEGLDFALAASFTAFWAASP